MHDNIDILTAVGLSEYDRRKIARVREDALQLPTAELRGEIIVVRGDDGGQTYFTIPANQVACSPRALARLVFDVDHLHWGAPDSVWLGFDERASAEETGGGMGGHEVGEGLWVHDVFRGSALEQRIREVLSGTRDGIWPNGSGPDGRPRSSEDLVDLLHDDDGRGSCYKLIRAIVGHCRTNPEPSFNARATAELRRFLVASSPRNRIEAATSLIDVAEPAELVAAVYDSASGTNRFPPWGWWGRRSVVVLGDLVRRGEHEALDAVQRLATDPGWIIRRGQWLFVDWTQFEERYADPDVFLAELRRLPGAKRVASIEEGTIFIT